MKKVKAVIKFYSHVPVLETGVWEWAIVGDAAPIIRNDALIYQYVVTKEEALRYIDEHGLVPVHRGTPPGRGVIYDTPEQDWYRLNCAAARRAREARRMKRHYGFRQPRTDRYTVNQ